MRVRAPMLAGAILLVPAAACGGNGDDVFSFADDDLCEWVSEDEVAEWVASEFDWRGTASAARTGGAADDGACEWHLSSTEEGRESSWVGVEDAAQWRDFDENPYDFGARMTQSGVTAYPPPDGHVEIGAWVIGHPSLTEGVVVHNGGFGMYAFGVPPGPYLQVSTLLYDSEDWDEGAAIADYEARFFAVADHFLQELGWSSSGD